MSRDDGWIRHKFPPGEEPTVYTAEYRLACYDPGMTTPHEPTSPLPQRKLILIPPPVKHPDDLLNAREVATMLNVTVDWVKNHSTRLMPFIPSVKWGDGPKGPRRYRHVDILRSVDDHMQTRPKKRK